MTMNLIEL